MHALRALNADSVKVEKDPVFSNSLASKITSNDTAIWNNKVGIEEDPVFRGSIAYSLNDSIVSRWDSSIVKELDPLFTTSSAAAITDTMIKRWDSSIIKELDPVFTAWDKDYADLTNKPVTDGSETKINAGRNIAISGNGTIASPYTIASGASIDIFTMSSNSLTVQSQKSVLYINSNNDGTIDNITLPTGTDGDIIYVIYNVSGGDSISINGTSFTSEKKFTYVFANGWHLMSAR